MSPALSAANGSLDFFVIDSLVSSRRVFYGVRTPGKHPASKAKRVSRDAIENLTWVFQVFPAYQSLQLPPSVSLFSPWGPELLTGSALA